MSDEVEQAENGATEWFADDAFWRTFFPYIFPAEKFEAAETEVDRVLELTEFSGRDVLDLACGPGRHALELASRGLRVVGVDRSEFLLSKAQARAEESGAEVEWLHADMRGFQRQGAFDLALNLYTSFGYFQDDRDNLQVLRNVCQSLRPGGKLILDMNGKESLARKLDEVRLSDFPDGAVLIERLAIEEDWRRQTSRWILIRNETVKTFEFSLRLYSGEEIMDALKGAGFSAARIYGDLDGGPYGLHASRLVAVATR